VRIIGGRWSGRVIDAPEGHGTRPPTDRIRQALFDWLGQDLSGVRMADVCSGSGAVAFEAASRGAAVVHAIEPERRAVAVLERNKAALGAAQVTVHARPFAAVLPGLRELDLVFADPPFPWYGERPEEIERLLNLAAHAVGVGGSVVIRGDHGTDLPPCLDLAEEDRRQWGRSWIAWLRRVKRAET
jgi:16S rRNA (guanine(966)-N(2))-methyltransferase RsmD